MLCSVATTNVVPTEAIIRGFDVIFGTISVAIVIDNGSVGFWLQDLFLSFIILRFTSSNVILVRSRTSSS